MKLESVKFGNKAPYYFKYVFEDFRFVAIKDNVGGFELVAGFEAKGIEEYREEVVCSYDYELPYCFGYYILMYHMLANGIPFEIFPGKHAMFYSRAVDLLAEYDVEIDVKLLNQLFSESDYEAFYEDLSEDDEVIKYQNDPFPLVEPYPTP